MRRRRISFDLLDWQWAYGLPYHVREDWIGWDRNVEDHSGRIVTKRSYPSVEGRITGLSIEELQTACNVHSLANEVQMSLDLADVSFADAVGILLLKKLQNRGVALVRASPFMAEQLRETTSDKV